MIALFQDAAWGREVSCIWHRDHSHFSVTATVLSERELRLSAEPQGLAEIQGRAPTSGCVPVWPRTNTWSCKDQGIVALLPSRAAAEEWQKAVQHSRGLLNKKQDGA